jgi:HAD superfamily hydrolase (TIGR01509 family)
MTLRNEPGLDLAEPTSTPRRRLKAVIFDMDGVIIDSHPAHRTAWRQFLHGMGREVSESELDFILDGRKRADILRYFLGDLSDAELAEHGRRKDEFFRQISLEVNPIPGVLAFLRELKSRNIAVAVATSATDSRARSTLQQLGLHEHFTVVVTGSDVTDGKPHPAIYELTCDRLKVDPKHALAMEDAVSGIHAAKQAGLRCIGISNQEYAGKLLQAGAHSVIKDFVGLSVEQLESVLNSNGSH